jgi:thiopeptide-type bacteriocin biosynthesis protein
MDHSRSWRQVNIAFPDWHRAEQTALAHLTPVLYAAEDGGMLDAWFFIRKRPCWRVRYLPTARTQAQAHIEQRLDELASGRHIDDWTRAVYEPEMHAFGGADGMARAHRLFHHDTRGLLDHLQRGTENGGHRRELSVMLCSILMRAAAQDWYERKATSGHASRSTANPPTPTPAPPRRCPPRCAD